MSLAGLTPWDRYFPDSLPNAWDLDYLGALALAAGALGTATFGIVDAIKVRRLRSAGFDRIVGELGPIYRSMSVAYGGAFDRVLESQYQDREKRDELLHRLKQGARIGLTPGTATDLAAYLSGHQFPPLELQALAQALAGGAALSPAQLQLLGRYELAVDARIEAALAVAETRYTQVIRWSAMVTAVVLAFVAGLVMQAPLLVALLLGVMAVPLAPIANDIAKALRAAGEVLKAKRA